MRRRNVGVFCCLLCLVLACSTMMFGCGKAKQEEQKSSTDQKTEKTDEPEETDVGMAPPEAVEELSEEVDDFLSDFFGYL